VNERKKKNGYNSRVENLENGEKKLTKKRPQVETISHAFSSGTKKTNVIKRGECQEH